jgi:hypothetical protein
MHSYKRWLLAFIFLLISSGLFAGVDVNVYDDAVYSYLDKLYAGGLLQTYMPNQRPLTRHVVANLVKEAKQNMKGAGPLTSIVGELEKEFADALSDKTVDFVPLDSLSLSYAATNQKESPVPDNGLGDASGRVQPLLSYNNGDHFDGHANFYSYSAHRVRATPYFAAYLQPKYFARSGEYNDGGIGLYRGYVKAGFKDFEILVGRDDIQWGPGENALFFSGNARALDMVKVSSPNPFRFPGALKHLGHFNATAFVSWLGSDYKRPANATLSGYRLDYSPFKWWNIGFDHTVFLGGDGSVGPDARAAFYNFIGFLSSKENDRAATNHLMGADTNVRIRQAMGMELYLKVLLEDTQAERRYMLKNDASWLGGIYFPKINGIEKLSLRGELIYTGQFAYGHGIYRDGFTVDDKFIGYDAGTDTVSGFLTSRYQFNLDEFIKIELRYLRRSNDRYKALFSSSGNNYAIARDIDNPEEGNSIIKLGGQKKLSKIANLYAEAGYDRKSNADYVKGQSANDFAFRMGLILHQFLAR